jgi:tryptophan 2,3-dioxygenase
MTPVEFLTFRERLESASGFQSHQFRELELALGHKRRAVVEHFPEGTPARSALEKRWRDPTLWDVFVGYLAREGYDVPEDVLRRDVTARPSPSPEVQAVLVDVYRRDPKNSLLCERLMDLDEGILEWRYRHVRMVERTIGRKRGTGGSAGSEYLHTTLDTRLFPDLWEIRSRL